MRRALAFGLVGAQFVLLAALVFVPHGTIWPVDGVVVAVAVVVVTAGMLLAVLGLVGLGPALTASPIPKENAPLVTGGVYAVVRNPIYTGLMAGGVGLVLLGASVWHIVVWVLLVVLLSSKTRWEERMLLAEHAEFAHYAARVGRFLPGIGRLRKR
ncbi:methyltransferase family protein [Lacisediminihabitans profunda]|uniref:Isoprenylcysteine carboxylmethyltransferase family protein n=1 Tax=Lacisediminihabitans profunda TaxID=2594790 RepID=A0A5C8UTK6_9MICO|nr:methyltransferase [Lacisediminihabitans profunda]TXN31953.1 isoprenylcysteine carboxylmethyltransferase family protein [Lacisediminihabitans profunda]